MKPHAFKPDDWAIRVVYDADGRELSRGLVMVTAAHSDNVVETEGPPERFKAGVSGWFFRIATSARTARDLGRLVVLEPDAAGSISDPVGLEHVSRPLARVLNGLKPMESK